MNLKTHIFILARLAKAAMFCFVFYVFFYPLSAYSQDSKKNDIYTYARKVVDTMASENMHGRGYVNDGDKIAANYIKTEFQKFNLKPFSDNYYQTFSFPVNTFPKNVSLNCSGKELIAGADFIPSCFNSSSSGKGTAVLADDALVENEKRFDKFLKQDFSGKIIIVNDTGKETPALHHLLADSLEALAVIELKDKLTWSIAPKQNNYSLFQVLRSSVHHPKKISFAADAVIIPKYQSQNVIGYIEGSEQADSFIVFSAHYDHLGQLGGKIYFPGANDNASGCAMLLNLARYYSMPEHKPKCSIAFISFGGEEAGLLGSRYFTEHPLFPLQNIKFLLNMDIMGTGEDGITVVNGALFKTEFERMQQINIENDLIKDVKMRGKAANSDHYYFSEKGVKAFFIYTLGGIKAYHDIYDKAETLPLNEFEDLFQLIIGFGGYLQN